MARVRKSVQLKKQRWHIGIYIRLSRDDGNDESLSVSNQRKILLEFVERNFGNQDEITDIYVDDGQSGTDYDRPDFQRLLRDMKEGKVNCIVCKNLSRAFRNYSDQGYFLEKVFPKYNIRFISLGYPKVDTFVDPESVNGLEVPINGLMNDRFACKTSFDVRATFDTKRRKGEFIGAFAPYGYIKDPENKNHLIVDPYAAQVIKDIFRWYVCGDGISLEGENTDGGISKEGIARRLNQMGIPNPTAYKQLKGLKYSHPQMAVNDGLWQGRSVSAILSNEVYIGNMVQGKQKVISYKVHDRVNVPEDGWYKVPATHEPIIDKSTFELAREMQSRDVRRPPGKNRPYLFAGLLKCADCHKSMTRRTSKNHVYFNCSTYKRKSKQLCTIHSIRLDRLETAVLEAIQRQIGADDMIAETILRNVKSQMECRRLNEGADTLVVFQKKELENVKHRMNDFYLDWKNGDISYEQYKTLKEQFENKMNRLETSVSHLEKECAQSEQQGNLFLQPYLKSFAEHKNIPYLTQGLLNHLIKEIRIHEKNVITIVFRYKIPYHI